MRRIFAVALALVLSASAVSPAWSRGAPSKGGLEYWKDHASNPNTANCNKNDQSGCMEK